MPQNTTAAGSTARGPAPPTDPAAHRDLAHPTGPTGPSALHTARYWIDPRRAVDGWRRRFGDVFTATINPLGRTVFVCDAARIRTILLAGDDTFRAARPTRSSATPALDGSVPAAAWLPFGGGIRRCLGATFALVEMRVILQAILRNRTIEPTAAPAEARRRRLVTVEPARGAVITVRPRRS